MAEVGAESAGNGRDGDGYGALVREGAADFRVGPRVYTDPAIFEAEMRRIFGRTWVYVAHESEVQAPGDYRTTYIGQQPVIVSRGEDGAIHVLFNVCRHRGNGLCREERGNANFFRCPYHGWVYKCSGELIGISHRQAYPEGFGQDITGLVRVPRVGVYRGLIFASLSPTGESLEEHLGGVRPYVDLWAELSPEGRVRVLRPHKSRCAGNWKFQAENGIDGYHPRFVHESAFNTKAHFEGWGVQQSPGMREVGQIVGFARGHAVLERPGMAALDSSILTDYMDCLVERYGRERAEEIVVGRNILIFPNVYLMDANIRVIQPIAVDRTEMYSYFTELVGVPDHVNRERLRDLQWRLSTTGFIITDDLEIFGANQSGVQVGAVEALPLARGLGREAVGADGGRAGGISDETSQRAIYREWVRLMTESTAGTGEY
jgi:benzoate/toluate 1,2-dioxygenase alpha subunit